MNIARIPDIKSIAYLAALGASLAMGAVIAKVPPAPVTPPSIITYYSDATKSNDVGSEIITCDRLRYFLWGHASPYKSEEPIYCVPPIES